jgi:peptide/nickel transport system substrate-binding protein
VALGVALVLAAGCGAPPAPAVEASTTIRMGLPVPPTRQRAIGASQVADALTREGLLVRGLHTGHEGRLADHWETFDEGRRLRFHLRTGVSYYDGTPLTAADVKTSIDSAREPSAGFSLYPMLQHASEVVVVDPQTLDIRLREPSVLFLDDLSVPVVRRAADGRVLTTGPFLIEAQTPELTVLRRNPHYYRGASPIDRVELIPYATVRAAWTAMMRDEIDFLYEVPADAREFVEGESSVRVYTFLRAYVFTLVFNTGRPVFRNPEVRRALSQAVDRETIVRAAMGGRGVAATGPIWPG